MPDDFSDYLPEKSNRVDTAEQEGIAKIIDLKLPLAWVISSAVVVSLSFGGLFMQVKGIGDQISELKNSSDNRDVQMSNVLQQIAQTNDKADTQQVEILNDQTSIATIQAEIVEIQKNIKWFPH